MCNLGIYACTFNEHDHESDQDFGVFNETLYETLI